MPPATDLLDFIGGFVAAEGCFTRSGNRFRFSLGLGATDEGMCEFMHDLFGVGILVRSPRRKPHYDDEIQFVVQATRELVEIVMPFMDEHLPASYKREQYHDWREQLLDYWLYTYGRKRCRMDGCGEFARAFGLCRGHLRTIRLS